MLTAYSEYTLQHVLTYWMGVALAIVLFACHHGYGGPINSFLSMPFWIPLSRLTYTAYLVHPIVLIAIISSERDSFYYTDVTITVYIAGTTILSYAAAALVSTFVEFPVANLEMAVFKALGIGLRESSRRVDTTKTVLSNQSSPLHTAAITMGKFNVIIFLIMSCNKNNLFL